MVGRKTGHFATKKKKFESKIRSLEFPFGSLTAQDTNEITVTNGSPRIPSFTGRLGVQGKF